MRLERLGIVCVALAAVGCGGSESHRPAGVNIAQRIAPPAAVAPPNQAAPVQGVPARLPDIQHKIIRTADMRLIVKDFARVAAQIDERVTKVQGYVANSSLGGSVGNARSGTWKVRIPVGAYESFLKGVESLGDLQNLTTDSQDVTAEFFDLEARIRNKQQEESRLLKHLEQSTGKLDEILTVEREISRVREELERMQGRRNLLQDLTAMTTVTIEVIEAQEFRPTVPPTYTSRISASYFGSLATLQTAAAELFLVLVVLAPWLSVLAIIALCAWLIRRAMIGLMPRPSAH